jgi:hypothetical protein
MAWAMTKGVGQLQPIGDAFVRAVRSDSTHLVAGLNLVEALVKAEQHGAATEEARKALRELGKFEAGLCICSPFHGGLCISPPPWQGGNSVRHAF